MAKSKCDADGGNTERDDDQIERYYYYDGAAIIWSKLLERFEYARHVGVVVQLWSSRNVMPVKTNL